MGENHDTIEIIDLASGRQRRLVRITTISPDTGGVDMGSLTWTADSTRVRYVVGTYVSGAGSAHEIHEVDLSARDRVVRSVPALQEPGHYLVLPAHGTSSRAAESVAEVYGPTGVSVPEERVRAFLEPYLTPKGQRWAEPLRSLELPDDDSGGAAAPSRWKFWKR
jgi:hypothetical protein